VRGDGPSKKVQRFLGKKVKQARKALTKAEKIAASTRPPSKKAKKFEKQIRRLNKVIAAIERKLPKFARKATRLSPGCQAAIDGILREAQPLIAALRI
jgi:septal ring factor EnvC (AmiA/AmiB activator)